MNPSCVLAARCSAAGAGLRSSIAGIKSEFKIRSVDALGNQRQIGGDAFSVVAKYLVNGPGELEEWEAGARSPPCGITTIGSVFDVGNGTYFASIQPTISGHHELAVTIHGLHIEGSPFSHKVDSNIAMADTSTADWGPGLEAAMVNVAANFTATARDVHGNPVLGADKHISCEVVENTNGSCSNSFGNGSTICTYTPVKSGMAELVVRYNGFHIAGSPFKVRIGDGAVVGDTSIAFGPGLSFAVAGELAYFSVAANDAGKNRIDDDRISRISNFSAFLTHRAAVSQTINARVSAVGGGIYMFEYNATIAGEYDLYIIDEALTNLTPISGKRVSMPFYCCVDILDAGFPRRRRAKPFFSVQANLRCLQRDNFLWKPDICP